MTTEQPTIESMNCTIAEFMGLAFERQRDLEYDESWDWLMEVVEKINDMPLTASFFINVEFTGVHGLEHGGQSIRTTIVKNPVEDKLIDSVYKSVYDYIVWYNTHK